MRISSSTQRRGGNATISQMIERSSRQRPPCGSAGWTGVNQQATAVERPCWRRQFRRQPVVVARTGCGRRPLGRCASEGGGRLQIRSLHRVLTVGKEGERVGNMVANRSFTFLARPGVQDTRHAQQSTSAPWQQGESSTIHGPSLRSRQVPQKTWVSRRLSPYGTTQSFWEGKPDGPPCTQETHHPTVPQAITRQYSPVVDMGMVGRKLEG